MLFLALLCLQKKFAVGEAGVEKSAKDSAGGLVAPTEDDVNVDASAEGAAEVIVDSCQLTTKNQKLNKQKSSPYQRRFLCPGGGIILRRGYG